MEEMTDRETARLMVVEDEADIRRWLCLELAHEGYRPEGFGDGASALQALQAAAGDPAERPFDLALIDIMLPGMSGTETCRRLRAWSDVPVILVTARDAVTDRVAGLDAGADDYISKPFAMEELLARIRAHLRRARAAARAAPAEAERPASLTCGALQLDPATRSVAVEGTPVSLTRTEFDLLADLMRNAGIVRSREALLRDVWGYDFLGDSKVVDVYVRYLRGKIDQRFGRSFIQTVRGVGYVLREG
jgi:two-component system response regulator ArlR